MPLEALAARTVLVVGLQAADDERALRLGEELGRVREVLMMKNESAPATTVASPSMMKIHAHAGLPPTPSNFEIAACNQRRTIGAGDHAEAAHAKRSGWA